MAATKRKTIKSFEAEIAELKAETARHSKRASELYAEKEFAVKSEADAREQFSDLKKRLSDAMMEAASLNGYIERVREDDIVREELVETGNEDDKRLVPKRKLNPIHAKEKMDHESFMGRTDRYGNPIQKPKHWTSY